jgi:hypothetical protein
MGTYGSAFRYPLSLLRYVCSDFKLDIAGGSGGARMGCIYEGYSDVASSLLVNCMAPWEEVVASAYAICYGR